MTETQLKQRLSAGVKDIDAPSDLLDRARLGGARRLRRRRFTAVAAASLAVAAIAGATFAVPAVRDRADQAQVATPTPWTDPITPNPLDRYALLMTGETGGDLAGDSAYLAQVLATWHDTQRKDRGKLIDPVAGDVWANLRGEPRIYWAGNTPAGRIALLVQHYQVPRPSSSSTITPKVPLPTARSTPGGILTVVAMVRDDSQGRPKVREFVTPYDDHSFPYFTIRDPGKSTFFYVIVSMGKRLGWRLSDGTATPFVFKDGVAVTELPIALINRMYIDPLPER
ncbi:hypothetical protein EV649_7233 [Kribbella sp. VKM Ac-2569]|uniref:hypothetical protein n=1 Tax=Kribbella sp. VKM Ac-2569 TaxID=2512220 RepID=UPI00102C86E0|nr:hypothetical protein [Kribbella sp. VKM Ac-2569]RZT12864.1 hypothetical protein EV649_7233 [Kribbella sp. VKM Ac-2569]